MEDRNPKLGASQPVRTTSGGRDVAMDAGELAEGSRFGNYIIGPCIGRGGMACIYSAEHEGLRRRVALKVLLNSRARDHEGHQRFLREARIAASIKHPNVVNIFDVGIYESIPYLVMELLEGEDLETLVLAKGKLNESMLVDIVVPIVSGLSAVHDAGFVHRDLKPGNIFLARGRNGEIEPKLLDFGISRAAEADQLRLTTAKSMRLGTPQYMSAEAIMGGEITALSDQYSLGVVLYECSTGFNPFVADSFAETVRRVTAGNVVPAWRGNPAVSRRVSNVIERAMSVDPSQRFKDLKEMGRELLSLAGQRTQVTWSLSFGEGAGKRSGMSHRVVESRPPRSRRALAFWRRTSQHPWFENRASIAAGMVGVLAFAAGIAILWSSQTRTRRVDTPSVHAISKVAPVAAPQPTPIAAPATRQDTAGVVRNQGKDATSTRGGAVRGAEVIGARDATKPTPAPRRPPPARDTVAAPAAASDLSSDGQERNGSSRIPSGRRAPPSPERTVEDRSADWVVVPDRPRADSERRQPTLPVGTNSAPIFE